MSATLDKASIRRLHANRQQAGDRLKDLLVYVNTLPNGGLADEVTLALEIIAGIGDKRAAKPLVEILTKPRECDYPGLNDEICRTLGKLGAREAIPAILDFVRKYGLDITIGTRAIRALGRLCAEEALPPLSVIACKVGYTEKGWEAARAIRIIGPEPVRVVFLEALKNLQIAPHASQALWIIDKPRVATLGDVAKCSACRGSGRTARFLVLPKRCDSCDGTGKAQWLVRDHGGLERFLGGYEERH